MPAIPLEFEYVPVEILSKEFTKLNSHHAYRVLYLGPRPLNTLALHKRYGIPDNQDQEDNDGKPADVLTFQKYRVNLRKIVNSYFNAVPQQGHRAGQVAVTTNLQYFTGPSKA